MTLEDLLRMKVHGKDPSDDYTPDFRVAIQSINEAGIHIIIHPDGYNGDTLDFLVKQNRLIPYEG